MLTIEERDKLESLSRELLIAFTAVLQIADEISTFKETLWKEEDPDPETLEKRESAFRVMGIETVAAMCCLSLYRKTINSAAKFAATQILQQYANEWAKVIATSIKLKAEILGGLDCCPVHGPDCDLDNLTFAEHVDANLKPIDPPEDKS